MGSQVIKGFSIVGLAGVGLLIVSLVGAPIAHAQGVIRADNLAYNTPRTHYYSFGDGDFVSGSNNDFSTSGGAGGAYQAVSGTGWLVAGLHIPDGAVITELRAYVQDEASGDLSVRISRRFHTAVAF